MDLNETLLEPRESLTNAIDADVTFSLIALSPQKDNKKSPFEIISNEMLDFKCSGANNRLEGTFQAINAADKQVQTSSTEKEFNKADYQISSKTQLVHKTPVDFLTNSPLPAFSSSSTFIENHGENTVNTNLGQQTNGPPKLNASFGDLVAAFEAVNITDAGNETFISCTDEFNQTQDQSTIFEDMGNVSQAHHEQSSINTPSEEAINVENKNSLTNVSQNQIGSCDAKNNESVDNSHADAPETSNTSLIQSVQVEEVGNSTIIICQENSPTETANDSCKEEAYTANAGEGSSCLILEENSPKSEKSAVSTDDNSDTVEDTTITIDKEKSYVVAETISFPVLQKENFKAQTPVLEPAEIEWENAEETTPKLNHDLSFSKTSQQSAANTQEVIPVKDIQEFLNASLSAMKGQKPHSKNDLNLKICHLQQQNCEFRLELLKYDEIYWRSRKIILEIIKNHGDIKSENLVSHLASLVASMNKKSIHLLDKVEACKLEQFSIFKLKEENSAMKEVFSTYECRLNSAATREHLLKSELNKVKLERDALKEELEKNTTIKLLLQDG